MHRRFYSLVAATLLGFAALPVSAQNYQIPVETLTRRANAALALLAYSVVPDLTSSFLSVSKSGGDQNDIYMTQFAGGGTMSTNIPVYLEGGVGYMRYDPNFVASNGTDTRPIPAKWNNLGLTGGIGWDFPVAENLVFRPIFNVSVGEVASDLSVASRYLAWKTGAAINFLNGGQMNAYGVGGSAMLDYEVRRPDHDIDIEWRYTDIRLQSFAGSSIQGSADAQTTSLYARWRAPTGLTAFDGPLRYVLEGAHTTYFGDQRGLLGFNYLSSIGAGVEFDTSAHDMYITRTRLVFRLSFGDNVRGAALGLAVSF